MTPLSPPGETPEILRLADLTPYLSVTVLVCTGDDPVVAFEALQRFLRRTAHDRGRAMDVRVRSETTLTGQDAIEDVGVLGELGFDDLYGISREVWRLPSWAALDSGMVDLTNELTIAVRRNRLVAICTTITTLPQFRKWIKRDLAPFRFLPPEVLASTFQGDGKMAWMRGVHRRRSTKADSKALGGIRIQDALHPIEDGTYTLAAAKVDFQPADDTCVLRDLLTVTPDKSHLSWKRPSYLPLYLAAVGEALDLLEKALVAPDEPPALFSELAVRETDLSRVRGAFDILVFDPDQIRAEPDTDDEQVERAELLLDAVLAVRGDPNSAVAMVDVGHGGALAGTLAIRPKEVSGGLDIDVRITGPVLHEPVLREIKDAIEAGDALAVYYQSAHVFDGHQVTRQRLVSRPFPNITFEDFSGFEVAREKPRQQPGQSLHDAIAVPGDDSLFAWVVKQFGDGWLLCDDGPGEVADFLHIANDRTLTIIHVKGADNHSPDRQIAVTRFEQVVSQAAKNSAFVDNDMLLDRLSGTHTTGSAAWHAGHRVPATEFLEQLRTRVASDKTFVVIVQPHLLQGEYDRARTASQAGQPSRDSYSLMLLDDLLHTTRRTITARCDDLMVIGCK